MPSDIPSLMSPLTWTQMVSSPFSPFPPFIFTMLSCLLFYLPLSLFSPALFLAPSPSLSLFTVIGWLRPNATKKSGLADKIFFCVEEWILNSKKTGETVTKVCLFPLTSPFLLWLLSALYPFSILPHRFFLRFLSRLLVIFQILMISSASPLVIVSPIFLVVAEQP